MMDIFYAVALNYAAPHLDAGRHFCYTNLVSGRNPEHGAFPKRS